MPPYQRAQQTDRNGFSFVSFFFFFNTIKRAVFARILIPVIAYTCMYFIFFSNSFSFSLPFHMYGYRILFILLALHSISLEPRDRRALRNALYNLSPYLSPNPYTQCRLIHVRNRCLLISRVLLLPSPLSVTYCCS